MQSVGAGLCSARRKAVNYQKSAANPYALSRLFVGADAYIGPLGSYEFAGDYRKNGAFCRADVGIGPYKAPALAPPHLTKL